MQIIVGYEMTNISSRDLRDRGLALDQIDEACSLLKRNLQDDYLVEAELEEQYMKRLVRFCHTGK
jgi:hypothetical protein